MDFALYVAFLDVFPFIVGFPATGNRYFQLGMPAFTDENSKRNNGQSFNLSAFLKFLDLLPVEQQLPATGRVVIVDGSLGVRIHGHPGDERLPLIYETITLAQAGLTLTDGLDLRARKHESGYILLQNFEVEVRLTISDIDILAEPVACHWKYFSVSGVKFS